MHDGHRARLRQGFLARGLDGLSEHRVLELLLVYALPRGDVNPLAHRLIETFGSLSGVFDATAEQLMEVPGVGESAAVLIKLMPALAGEYLKSRTAGDRIIRRTEEIEALFRPYFFGARSEMICLAGLDAKYKLLGVKKLTEGIPNAAEITGRKVVEAALGFNASVVVLAHNHTSGLAVPSKADVLTTQYLLDLLGKVGVELLDHVILADDDMVSLRESGYLGD